MEKNDIREKLDEMKKLSAAGKDEAAAKVADEIPWRKSHNINVMVRIAKVYQAVGRLDDSEEILEFAYDRSPVARMVVYELAMLGILRGNLEKADIYYNDFVELAPHDSLRYVIKYKLSKARGADNATLISILEELKEEDFTEEWAYELANLYHKAGETEKCIDLCDEIILWFGDGPYVERALEIKMCYQPLDERQEDKYRQIRAKQDGVTEIRPGEESSGEKLDSTIRIPEIQPPTEKYDTINLQAEIRKSIEEIMEAEEADKVNESMENIKSLVEDIPYLQPDKHVTGPLPEEVEAEEEINREINERFRELLAEEYDGQVSIVLPERIEGEPQIEGQMTIDEMMLIWDKMRKAAAATLHEADEKKLEIEKARALREANNIKEKLDEVAPALEAGVPSAELMKEDILHGRESVKEKAANGIFDIGTGFTIPKVTASGEQGDEPGLVIPVISQEEANIGSTPGQNTKPLPEIIHPMEWEPEKFDEPKEEPAPAAEEPTSAAAEEVPAAEEEPAAAAEEVPTVQEEPVPIVEEVPTVQEESAPAVEETPAAPETPEITDETQQKIASIMTNLNNKLQENIDTLIEEEKAELAQAAPAPSAKTTPLPLIDVSKMLEEEPEPAPAQVDITQEARSVPEVSAPQPAPAPAEEESEELPVIPEYVPTAPLPNLDEYQVERRVIEKLTEAQQERLSYFAAVKSLQPQICTALGSTMTCLENRALLKGGNLLVVGDAGSGKTMLCTALVKIMQDEIKKPAGKIGKLTGKAINDKDLEKVLSQVAGGTLIVEDCGDMMKDTADTLAALLDRPDSNIFVILEGELEDIKKVMALSQPLASLFTEKIIIPGLSDKELVSFAESYCKEKGFSLGDEGLLALYDRIRLIKQPTKNTTITDVKDILDNAMQKATKKGVKGFFSGMSSKRYDEDDNIILREKDFS